MGITLVLSQWSNISRNIYV